MKIKLSQIYRQLTRSKAGEEVLSNPDRLLKLACRELPVAQREAVLDQIAQSSAEADVLRFAIALESISKNLSQNLATRLDLKGSTLLPVFSSTSTSGWGRSTRRTIAKRTMVGAAVAAALMIGLLPLHSSYETSPTLPSARPDRIFAWSSDKATSAQGETLRADEIFRGDFKDG